MARGQPDFGSTAPTETIVGISDMGELAARLGSPVTFDRRGNLVWFDDFEDGINKWLLSVFGVGSSVVVSSDIARNGLLSARLTTGNKTNDYAKITHYLPLPVTSRVGLEISFTLDADLSEFIVTHIFLDGTFCHYTSLRYIPNTDKLQYYDSAGQWQDLDDDLPLTEEYPIFHTVKMVVDLSTRKYVRVILNNIEYDMSALSYYGYPNFESPKCEHYVFIQTGVNDNLSVYIDDVIVTQNEP